MYYLFLENTTNNKPTKLVGNKPKQTQSSQQNLCVKLNFGNFCLYDQEFNARFDECTSHVLVLLFLQTVVEAIQLTEFC